LMKALYENDQATVKELLPDQGNPEGDVYDTGLKVVVPDSDSPLKSEAFDKKTQFLKLSEFKQWLEKYHLTGPVWGRRPPPPPGRAPRGGSWPPSGRCSGPSGPCCWRSSSSSC